MKFSVVLQCDTTDYIKIYVICKGRKQPGATLLYTQNECCMNKFIDHGTSYHSMYAVAINCCNYLAIK